ncbi:uncharacterized protein L3040_006487 [Drepanopeziza brunnea f. sp. 'multigermtubi']|uniref:Uncharacterized protein n=1 Tax=Marssonina brunnea f. sp. multigermtubi (strain MB_m1) TaxID=1072389 RepID=K1XDQ1_MARBU|nr:uncharacterized protein MBM_02230 [Drepanopeziza brunnea f. sp. 'multigermtubi' MB_m1]EKD18993.1 hypothetical protein MBM_02230 [Drepanopeziza brunnea f. sp. 'multigermtubi' MB_m1]KAJ5038808.1 hypothetical protein L3040_006487 [Drepanopeziza brunnea f. sp. 'multigermtubi']
MDEQTTPLSDDSLEGAISSSDIHWPRKDSTAPPDEAESTAIPENATPSSTPTQIFAGDTSSSDPGSAIPVQAITQNSRLLRLPSELRRVIWKFVFETPRVGRVGHLTAG